MYLQFYNTLNMEMLNAAELLAALGHESRLSVFRLLVEAGPEGMNASAIGEKLGLAPATLSFHLAHLSRVGLIKGRQESRFIFYSAYYTVMDDLLAFLTHNCCQGKNDCLPRVDSMKTMNERIFSVLFLCTGNSARSILAEAILNHIGRGRFKAYSAGSHPAGSINPFALEILKQQGMPTDDLRSKNWDEFSEPDAPRLDFVITVCDKAAGEACPVWPGQPMTAHWGIEDPAAVQGDDEAKRRAVTKAFREMSTRISLFTSLPLQKLDTLALKKELDTIGKLRDKGQ